MLHVKTVSQVYKAIAHAISYSPVVVITIILMCTTEEYFTLPNISLSLQMYT